MNVISDHGQGLSRSLNRDEVVFSGGTTGIEGRKDLFIPYK